MKLHCSHQMQICPIIVTGNKRCTLHALVNIFQPFLSHILPKYGKTMNTLYLLRCILSQYVHLLEFTFFYQFYSRITTLVVLTFWNPVELFVYISFHSHFKLFWSNERPFLPLSLLMYCKITTKQIMFLHLTYNFDCHSSWKYS